MIKKIKLCAFISLTVLSLVLLVSGIIKTNSIVKEYTFTGTSEFVRVDNGTEYEDETVCPVVFENSDGVECVKSYSFAEWEKLSLNEKIEGYIFKLSTGEILAFPEMVGEKEIIEKQKNDKSEEASDLYATALALALAAIGMAVMFFFGKHFTVYEQIWFLSILVLASLVSVLFPESEINGIKGIYIMGLYLADTFLNILCELLISKQSKWNFIVSVFVEITEIAICVVLAYRFATLASTLFFWLPCDIISFVNWHRHPDRVEEELTEVRSLKGWQELLVVIGIIVWTLGVGYLLTTIDVGTDIFGNNKSLEILVCFLDACASAVGIVNGIFILLRLKEQWIAWYISAVIEGVINILSGQFVLIVLKIGYLTNTTYGYIKWSKYIKNHSDR